MPLSDPKAASATPLLLATTSEWRIVVENKLGRHVTHCADEHQARHRLDRIELGGPIGNTAWLERREVTEWKGATVV